jgi:hypothetical protein
MASLEVGQLRSEVVGISSKLYELSFRGEIPAEIRLMLRAASNIVEGACCDVDSCTAAEEMILNGVIDAVMTA